MSKNGYTMNKKLIWLMIVVACLICFGIANGVLAQGDFPTKSIQLICPYGAGGSTSMGSRIIAGTLSEYLGKPVIVINKAGAGGSIAAEYVAKSKPDGYTIFVFNSGSNGVTIATRSVRYTNDDFELFGEYATTPMGMIVAKDAPFQTFPELVEYVKKNPGKMKYGTSGVGTSGHFGMELIKIAAGGLKIPMVPFKSGAEFFSALLGGHVQMGFWYQSGFKSHVQAGRFRLLAMGTPTRVKDFPDVPTFTEIGYPKIQLGTWYGLSGPRGLPKEVSAKLRDASMKTFKHPEVQKMLGKLGYIPTVRDAEEFRKFIKEADKNYRWIAKEAGIKIE